MPTSFYIVAHLERRKILRDGLKRFYFPEIVFLIYDANTKHECPLGYIAFVIKLYIKPWNLVTLI